MKTIKFDVAILKGDENFFTYKIPGLPDLWGFKYSAEEIIKDAREGIVSYLSGCTERGKKINYVPYDLFAIKNEEEYEGAKWVVIEVDRRLKFKNSKRERRARIPFNLGFFTLGTVCEVHVNHRQGPKIITVRGVVNNGPDSYVIKTGEMREHIGEEAYNIGWVTRIIKQVPGHVKIEDDNTAAERQKYFERDHRPDSYDEYSFKHPSQYRTTSLCELLMYTAIEYVAKDQLLDLDKLVKMALAQGIVKRVAIDERFDDYFSVFEANKKKFRRRVRQLVRHCLTCQKKAVREYDSMMSDIYRDDDEREGSLTDCDGNDTKVDEHQSPETNEQLQATLDAVPFNNDF